MASRLATQMRLPFSLRPSRISSLTPQSYIVQGAQRSFQTSRTLRQDGITGARRPIGGFRGTLFGFLLGSFLAGSGLYYYVVDEYKVSNELLTEDIYALQAAVQRLEGYVRSLEEETKTKK